MLEIALWSLRYFLFLYNSFQNSGQYDILLPFFFFLGGYVPHIHFEWVEAIFESRGQKSALLKIFLDSSR